MEPITIAILIPCYNSANFLPELFDGIHNQSVPFDEIICYDDCSSDNTIEIAKSLGAIVIEGKKNKGPAFGRNKLIEACNCTYIHFHDSDDLIAADFVEKMKSKITDENMQLLCNSHVLDRNNRSTVLGDICYNDLSGYHDQIEYFLLHVGYASMGLYSKKALQAINGFNEELIGAEDPDLHIRLSAANFKIEPIKEYLATKLEHGQSLSHQQWFQCMIDKLKCLEYYLNALDKKYSFIIGEQILTLSNYFYREGHPELSLKARKIAYQTGIKQLNSSIFSKYMTTIFGLSFYLWLYRRRVDFKLN